MTTIEMRQTDIGEWVAVDKTLPDNEPGQDRAQERQVAFNQIFEYFSYDPRSAFSHYVEASQKNIQAGVFTQAEIDKHAKPYIVASLKRAAQQYSFSTLMVLMKDWLGVRLIDGDDKKELMASEEVREVVSKEVKDIISHHWRNRKFMGYPSNYPTVLDIYVYDGAIGGKEAQDLWEEPLKSANG